MPDSHRAPTEIKCICGLNVGHEQIVPHVIMVRDSAMQWGITLLIAQ